MWEYMDRKNITIEENTPHLELRRETDVFLMQMGLQNNISAPNLTSETRTELR